MELYKLNDCINDTFFKLPHELFENINSTISKKMYTKRRTRGTMKMFCGRV